MSINYSLSLGIHKVIDNKTCDNSKVLADKIMVWKIGKSYNKKIWNKNSTVILKSKVQKPYLHAYVFPEAAFLVLCLYP